MKIRNPARFWLGVVMAAAEFLALAIYGATLLDWSWLTIERATAGMLVVLVTLYNGLAILLVWNGSKNQN